jgi:hypothetical protein
MQISTINSDNIVRTFDTIYKAFCHAEEDPSVYKISFIHERGEKIYLLVRTNKPGVWYQDPVIYHPDCRRNDDCACNELNYKYAPPGEWTEMNLIENIDLDDLAYYEEWGMVRP